MRTGDTWGPVLAATDAPSSNAVATTPEVAGTSLQAPATATPIPTVAPTAPPVSTPVPIPSAPTDADDAAPTVEPTVAPTATPTVAPTPAPTAPPVSTVSARGQEALGLIWYDWQGRLSGWTVEFHPERSGLRGLTFTAERRIEIYVRAGDSTWDIARILAHEIGHAVDVSLNNASERDAWLAQRGISVPWWPGSGTSDFNSGAGDFAECFATWVVGSSSLSIGGACSQADLDLLASLS